jgi:hypothetical protein
MVSGLKEIDSTLRNEIDDTVLFCKPSRPSAGRKIFQRLRFSDSSERIPTNRFNKVQRAKSGFSICLDPESEILNELRLENWHPFPVS